MRLKTKLNNNNQKETENKEVKFPTLNFILYFREKNLIF